jgi:hypothetical protein
VFRALISSALSIVVLITLLWGGCISCPQFFMFNAQAEKDCCNDAGQCERPSNNTPVKECKRMPLELKGFSSALAVAQVTTDILPLAPTLRLTMAAPHVETAADEHSPPDLSVLHSAFLI